MSAKHAHPTLIISPSLNPNENAILRVETSLVMSHTDAPQEPELESCNIKKTSYGGGGVKEDVSRRPRISLHI